MTVVLDFNSILIAIGILSIWLLPIFYGENKCKSDYGCIPLMTAITLPIVWFILALIAYFTK